MYIKYPLITNIIQFKAFSFSEKTNIVLDRNYQIACKERRLDGQHPGDARPLSQHRAGSIIIDPIK